MNLNDLKWVFCLLALPFLLFSCGGSKDDPTPPGPEPPEPPVVTEGSIEILPGGSTFQLPALQYRFYNTDGTTACVVLNCDGLGNFKGSLPLGTYRVIAANTSASGVEFRDLDDHSKASVHASVAVPSRAGGYTMVSQPDKVYAAVVNEVSVTAEGTASHKPVPVLLTKTFSISFSLAGGLGSDIASIEGTLPGVYPSVNLFTCAPVSTLASDCADIAVRFPVTGSGGDRAADINLFGICNPQGGTAYTSILTLDITMANGDKEELEIDLTGFLTDAISKNDGKLPSDLQVPVTVEREAIGLNATVGEWRAGGESNKEL